MSSRAAPTPFVALVVVSAALWLAVGDWIAAAGVLVLWAGWHYLPRDEGPPVLALALSFQWFQVCGRLYYPALTGRSLFTLEVCDYRPMFLIGLGCCLSLLLGLVLGARLLKRRAAPSSSGLAHAFTGGGLIRLYVLSVILTGPMQNVAWQVPGLTQGILALSFAHLALLFLVIRRLSYPRFRGLAIAMLLLFEVILGFTGYFAGFREPLMMAVLVLLERFSRRSWKSVAALGGLGAVALLMGVLWMGIRTDYRRDFQMEAFEQSRSIRFERIASLSSSWFDQGLEATLVDVDALVDRLAAIHYPALAVSRVPAVLPHEHGAILWNAVRHVLTPRLLFPNKPDLIPDSEKVRKYSGVWVAGPEEDTSIAFGYAAESYVDFGVPGMFVPVFVYGILMGAAYRWFLNRIRHEELAVGFIATAFWISLYLFERSWAHVLGLSGTLMIYLGGLVLLVDRRLARSRANGTGAADGRLAARV